VLNNFPSYQPARKFAHQIQHQKEGHRFPIDDLFFIETIPALVSYLTMPLRFSDEQGTEHTWDPDNLIANLAYLPGFLFNQLCLGHTHYPQAQPYFDIEGMLAGPLADVADDLRSTLAELLFGFELSLNFIRSHYYNSGTAGWHEGVIWAIEINEHGEARLVFWTEDTRLDRPQTMNWQLPRMEDALRRALEGKKEDFEDYLAQLGQLFGASLHEIVTNLGTAVTLPFALLLEHPDELDELVGQGINVDLSGMQQTIQAQWQQVTHWLLRFFLALYRRLDGQKFTLSIPLPAELAAALANIQTLIQALPFPDVADDQLRERATELACIWLLANHSSGILDRSGRRTSLFRSTYPLAWMALALVAIMPGPGDDTLPPLPFTSSVTTETDQGKTTLKLTITINLDT
jgi:hypothetical protein